MEKLLCLAILCFTLQYATGALLLGSKRCTWGPSYWCSHLGTMKECKSSGYCIRLWQRSPPSYGSSGGPTTVSPDCAFCRLLATDLERLARANKTAAESRKLATAACSLVPEQRQRALCLAMVDNYLDEAIQLLREGLSADKLCTASSLCGSTRVDPKLQVAAEVTTPRPIVRVPLGAERLSDGVCDLCLGFVTLVKQAAEGKSAVTEVTQLMKEAVCARLTEAKSLCNLWMDSYVPQVMRMLAEKVDPKQICISTRVCPAAAAKFQRHPLMQLMTLQMSPVKPLRGVECQFCELLVSQARQMLQENKTQEEILQFVRDRVCTLVPAEKDKCIQAVSEYGPIIFQLLSSELDPTTVCQALGACGTGKSAAVTAAKAATAGFGRARLGPQCLLCEFVMRELDKALGDNRTVAAIESALETVCSIMPQTVRSDCDDWVLKYTPAVLELLTQDLGPTMVCTVLGLCVGDAQRLKVAAAAAPANSATTCDICQTVIVYVKSLLKENATEQEVVAVLEKVCNFLPSQEQPACRSFIEQYTPYIIELLLQDTDPKTICQTIGLCPKSAAKSAALRYRPVGPLGRPSAQGPLV